MMISLLSKIEKKVPRIHNEHWLSFVYDLSAGLPIRRNTADDLHIRRATEKDIEIISGSDESKEPIVTSCLRFWNDHGFRGLYLGFLDNHQEPAIFQYVMDNADNERYASMVYGNMYRRQSGDSVQVENIYSFRSQRRNHLAIDFEARLFTLLKQMGKKKVRTHINVKNKPALFWARLVGFRPDSWITMVSIDLPFFRSLKKKFVFSGIREAEYESFPLSLFKS
jgi:hypothetical protein